MDDTAGSVALFSGLILLWLFVAVVGYVYMSACLMTIGKKTGQSELWMAWVPIINLYFMTRIAGKPWWWLLLCFIPCVNIVVMVLLWMAVAEARGKPSWWGILTLVPCVNLIVPAYLAFSD